MLQVSDCIAFCIMCDVPSIAVFCNESAAADAAAEQDDDDDDDDDCANQKYSFLVCVI